MRGFFIGSWVLLAALGVACVGDSPVEGGGGSSSSSGEGGASSSSSSGGGSSGTPDATASSSSGEPDGGGDGAIVHTGGETLAQLVFDTQAFNNRVVAPAGGGVLFALAYDNSTPLQVAGQTIPCTTCAVLLKMNAALDALEWYAYAKDLVERSAVVSVSPDGRIYWALSASYAGTAEIHGSNFGSTLQFPVVSGDGQQDSGTGGSRFVIALQPNGSVRWSHALAQTNVGDQNYLGSFQGFAANDKNVLITIDAARGTLAYTNSLGNPATQDVSASYLVHELDAETGRTAVLGVLDRSGAFEQTDRAAAFRGFAGKGFTAVRRAFPAGSNVPSSYGVTMGELSGGALSAPLSYPSVVPAGKPNSFFPTSYKDTVVVAATAPGSHSLAGVTQQSNAGSYDTALYLLDKTSVNVRAQAIFGGDGYEEPQAASEIPSSDELYLGGVYRSSNFQLAGVTLPTPPDALSNGSFVTRLGVGGGTFTPYWARGLAGNPTGRVDASSVATDTVSGDVYVSGWVGPSGTYDFGASAFTTSPVQSKAFLLRLRRGD